MGTTAPTKYDPQFGFTEDGRKVHMGWEWNGVRDVHSRLQIVDVVAWSATDDGLRGVLVALVAAKISVRRLCGRCFATTTRQAYEELYRAAGGAK